MSFRPLSEGVDRIHPSGLSDLLGWELRTMVDGEKVGEVEDLLVDEGGTVHYLDVDLYVADKHVLVPMDRARIDQSEGVVWVPGLNRMEIEEVPRYDHDPGVLTPEYEAQIARAYDTPQPDRLPSYRVEVAPGRDAALTTTRLLMLSEVGEFEVAPGETDPRDWDLVLADRRAVGRVHDLVIDPDGERVRYLDCELTIPGSGGRHILVPVEFAYLDDRELQVFVGGLTTAALAELPSFPGLPLAPEIEERNLEIFRNLDGEGW